MLGNTQPTIVLAAGGTGGHIFPAQALAEELLRRGARVHLCTDSRFSDYSAASMQGVLGTIPIHSIKAGTLGKNPLQRIKGVLRIIQGTMQARAILRKIAPHAVVGFGGYPSFPTMIAATGLRFPTLIHEQNAVLGKANRMLAPRVDAIATSFPETSRIQPEHAGKVRMVGNPVRSSVRALHDVPYPTISEDTILRILVTGGSQGANIFASIVPEAVSLLEPRLRKRLRIDQQTRKEDMEETRNHYESLGVTADLSPFFSDVPARLGAAHLLIARSGASTIAELTCSGRPALLVPYPGSADAHQLMNAQALEDAGGGWVMPQESFTPQALAARLEHYLTAPSTLSKAAMAAHAMGRSRAASDLADIVLADIAKRN